MLHLNFEGLSFVETFTSLLWCIHYPSMCCDVKIYW